MPKEYNKKYQDSVGRRKNDPLPNIIRIETLSKNALKEYLTIYGDISQDIQHSLRNIAGLDDELLFYGFMQNETMSINMTTSWERESSKTVLDRFGNEQSVSQKLEPTFIDRLKTSVSAVASGANKLLEPKVTRAVGVNSSLTGSSTQKHFKGIDIGGGSITCGWYLPQSLKQAVIGLKTITEMIYPQSIASKRTNYNSRQRDNTLGIIDDSVKDISGQISHILNQNKDILIKLKNLASQQIANGDWAAVGEDFLGLNLTFDPRPVRISIGNKAVLEPMIIKSLDIKFSKESFLKTFDDNSKKLLPEFVMVTISYEYWLTPGPLKNKMKLLGLPMFSTSDDRNFKRSTLGDSEFNNVFNRNGKGTK